MHERRVHGFGVSLLALGASCELLALLLATGSVPDAFAGPRPYWSVLAVVGVLYLLLGVQYLSLLRRAGVDGDVYLGMGLFQTTGVTLSAATAQLALFVVHAVGLRLEFHPDLLAFTSNPLLYGALTTLASFFAILAAFAYFWSRGRGTGWRKGMAARKHLLAMILLLVPWLLPPGFFMA